MPAAARRAACLEAQCRAPVDSRAMTSRLCGSCTNFSMLSMISGPMPSSGTASGGSPFFLRRAFSLRIASFSAASAAQSASSSASQRAEVPRQDLGHLLADAGNAEREDEARQVHVARALDAVDHVLRRLLGHALQAGERRLVQRGRGPPGSSPGRARPAARPASRPGLRCPSRAGRRSAAAPACAAPCSTGRRCSASRPRLGSRTTGDSHTGQRCRHREAVCRAARPLRRARRRPRESRRRRGARPPCRRPRRPCAAARPRCAASRW